MDAVTRPGPAFDFFVVSCTLLDEHGRLLLVRKRGTHRFMLPGGKVEQGETSEQAVKREIEEELETEINVGRLVVDVNHDYPTFHWSAPISCTSPSASRTYAATAWTAGGL